MTLKVPVMLVSSRVRRFDAPRAFLASISRALHIY